MKLLLTGTLLLLLNAAFPQPTAWPLPQPPAWPHHKKAVIVLTYDDALLSQLNNAVPQLIKAGFPATFFLTSDMDSSTIPRWRALAKKGFELGNHTLYHPCSSTEDVPVTSEHYTPHQMIEEIGIMNHLLFAIDGINGRTYAYPCTETTVGGGKDYVDTLRRYRLIKYARIGGDTGSVITDFAHLDPLRIPSLGLEDSTSATLVIDYVKSVQARGGLGIIMFHGIGGDYITTSADVHQQLIDYLKKNKKDIWVTTFREAMDYIFATVPPVKPSAADYFKEAQTLCARDNGRLWGIPICAPMIIADLRTQTFTASQPPPNAPRPKEIGYVNAPVSWGGSTWIAYTWQDLSTAPDWRRKEIMLHEMFHGIQPQLKLGVGLLENEHLDALEGRYWMQLEWRALTRALSSSGTQRNSAIRDALAFRQQRRQIYPSAAANERALEINEGTASYTGTVLAASSRTEAIAHAIITLTPADKDASFVRTFAYASGPAYGLLLDEAKPGWQRSLRASDDLGTLLMTALSLQPSPDATAAAAQYDGPQLLASEQHRDQQRQDRINDLRRKFVEGPVLILPGGGRSSSDSRGATVIPGAGTVYFHTYSASGPWGSFSSENGVLLATDGQSRRLPSPTRQNETTLSGDGWTFTAAPGWTVRPGPRSGDFEVVNQPDRAKP